ncbi:hypothetical protein [Methanosarcina sp.]|uniref:hypothetical protein n=1 Tax=Methanosarcina sp. TaxID=2213 RepID=UPI003C7799EA
MNDAILSKKPKTLAISPAFATASSDFFSLNLARMIPRMEKGIAKEVENRLPAPSQKEREIITLIIPDVRLRIPFNPETPLILTPPARNFDKKIGLPFSFNHDRVFFFCSNVKQKL